MPDTREHELLTQVEQLARQLNELDVVTAGDRYHDLVVRFRFLAERSGHTSTQVTVNAGGAMLDREWREDTRPPGVYVSS